MMLYAMSKITDEITNRYTNNKDKIINLIEIIINIVLTFFIYKV